MSWGEKKLEKIEERVWHTTGGTFPSHHCFASIVDLASYWVQWSFKCLAERILKYSKFGDQYSLILEMKLGSSWMLQGFFVGKGLYRCETWLGRTWLAETEMWHESFETPVRGNCSPRTVLGVASVLTADPQFRHLSIHSTTCCEAFAYYNVLSLQKLKASSWT